MKYFHCDTFSNVSVNYPFLTMCSDRTDIVKSFSWCSFFSSYVLYLHTPIYRKIKTPLMKENPWVLCLVQQSNYLHQTLPGYHTQVPMHFVNYFLFQQPNGSNTSKSFSKTVYTPRFRDIFMIWKNCIF